MLEKEIERKLHEGVKNLHCGAKCYKFVSPGCTGVPDRLILLPGDKAVFVELKAPKKKERARQNYVQSQIHNLGFKVFSTINTVEKVQEVIDWCRDWCVTYYENMGKGYKRIWGK